MKTSIVTAFICLWLTSKMSGQTDSIRLEVTKTRTRAALTKYKFKDEWNRKFKTTWTDCEKHKKGEYVLISKKDIGFIEPKNY